MDMMDNFSIKITKTKSLYKGMNFEEFQVWGKIYNYNKTKYRKFTFVLTLDYESMFEYYQKDKITNQEIKQYKDDAIFDNFTSYIVSYNNTVYFYKICEKSIKNYNKDYNSRISNITYGSLF